MKICLLKSTAGALLSAFFVITLVTGCSNNSGGQPQPAERTEDKSKPEPIVPAPVPPQPAPSKDEKPQPEPRAEQPTAPQSEGIEQPVQPTAEETVQEPVPSIEDTASAKLKQASKKLGFQIEADLELEPSEIDKGLTLLERAVAEVKAFHASEKLKSGQSARLEPIFDYILLSKKNERPIERNEMIRVRFAVDQTDSQAKSALKFEFARCEPELIGTTDADRLQNCIQHPQAKTFETFRRARNVLRAVRNAIPSVQINCSAPVVECAIGAHKFKSALPSLSPEMASLITEVTVSTRTLWTLLVPGTFSVAADGKLNLDLVYSASPKALVDFVNKSHVPVNQ